jgi:hypothetical protein
MGSKADGSRIYPMDATPKKQNEKAKFVEFPSVDSPT